MGTIDHKSVTQKERTNIRRMWKGGTNRKEWLQDNPNNMEMSEE